MLFYIFIIQNDVFKIKIKIKGDFVKVEADRGEDLGIVCGKIASSDFREERPTAGYRGRGSSIIQG
jgi:uncharacterized protein YajQ (UPF0234 family)